MSLGYPTSGGTSETQQFGPGITLEPAMFASGTAVAWWQPYKGWGFYPHYHGGIDVAGASGTTLLALETGKVTYRGWVNGGGGYMIEVEVRPGTRYSFAHCSAFLVALGAIVKKGQAIARIGMTGNTTGNHVHVGLAIREIGPDGWPRDLLWNPKLWMAGGAYANDARITPAYAVAAPAQYVRVAVGVNIRTAPKLAAQYVYRTTTATYISPLKLRYGGTVVGEVHNVGFMGNAQWAKVWLNSAYRYVAKPFVKFV